MEPRTLNIGKFGLKEDRRNQETRYQNAFSEKKKNLYDTLVNMVVNHKMELQKIPAASHIDTATEWAEKRGLRAGQEDFDKDGHPETVIYNRAGQPFIINGYKLKASDYPVRNAYWGSHKTSEERAGEPMREWVRQQAYNEEIDPEHPWKRTITMTPFGSKLKEWGYRMPTKPKKQISVFSHFCKLISPYVKTYFSNGELMRLLSANATDSSATILKKIISPITIYRMLYMKIVERWYFFHLRRGGVDMTYKDFKQYCKNNPGKFWTFYMENILGDFEHFKPNIVDDGVVSRLFVKGSIQWDFSDPDDAILFLIGKDNIEDDVFTDIIQNEGCAKDANGIILTPGNADNFINDLQHGDKATKKTATKLIEKWKVRARKGTKQFFEQQVQYLMENDGAYQRYLAMIDAARNPIDPEAETAAPASPERSTESGTAVEQPVPTQTPPGTPTRTVNEEEDQGQQGEEDEENA